MELMLKINYSDDQISYLTSVFDATPVSLAEREDGVYLRSTEIVEGEMDEDNSEFISESWEQARQFIAHVNGAAIIEDEGWTPLSLEKMKVVSPDGTEEWFPIRIIACAGLRRRKSMPAKNLLPLADENVHVAKALRLHCQDMDWVNLYRLLEVVREDVGGDDQIAKTAGH